MNQTKKIGDLYDADKKWEMTKKVGEVKLPCTHPNHEPPKHRFFPPGIYEHTCPACGHVTRFTVYPVGSSL